MRRTVTVDADHLRDLMRAVRDARAAAIVALRASWTSGAADLEPVSQATAESMREVERLEMAHPELRP